MKPLLVGEDNPYGVDSRYALYPNPVRSAGFRLCHTILGFRSAWGYLRAFDRVNLCAGRWSMPEARAKASEIARERDGRVVILLGAKVSTAFGFAYDPFVRWGRGPDGAGPGVVIILPHPSGRCRLWNERGAIERARALVLPLIEKGAA